MKKSSKAAFPPLDERFDLLRGTSSDKLARPSQLWTATDRTNGEAYLVRLFKKTGKEVDADLRGLLDAMIRRVRRVLAVQAAREVLVGIEGIIEDENEIGVLMRSEGTPLEQIDARTKRRLKESARSTAGRSLIWREIARMASAIGYLHSAGLVHGMLDECAVLVDRISPLELRLGGYEACIHVASSGNANLAASQGIVSFRRDWADLGKLAEALLDVESAHAPELVPAERRLIDRLKRPPRFERLDGVAIADEISTLAEELDRIGSSGRHELVLLPSRDLLRRDLPALVGDKIAAQDVDSLLKFLVDDLTGPRTMAVRAYSGQRHDVLLATDRATYKIRIWGEEDRIGQVVACGPRRSDDPTYDAIDIEPNIFICRDPQAAKNRIRTSGGGAISWNTVGEPRSGVNVSVDPPQWHALILIEIFSLLASQFRHYPVEYFDAPDENHIRLSARLDAGRDERRSVLGLLSAAESLDREMRRDDSQIEWTLATSDAITLGPNAPRLTLTDVVEENGRRLYCFHHEGMIQANLHQILRPRPEAGTERAIKRRLNNIVAARGNLDLLLAIDDPDRVVLEEALRNIAAPGIPPRDMDGSKESAWTAIKEGHSLDLVVGPPGVGKTFLVSRLVQSILKGSRSTRILISAQNHDALAEMHRKLVEILPKPENIVVRVERRDVGTNSTTLRKDGKELLKTVLRTDNSARLHEVRRLTARAVVAKSNELDSETEAVLRDTDHLLLRSADITLATTNSATIEEMIDEGEQFDWVIVEEAARANGPELVGPLLLGNRRILIGDHHQLAPFDAERRARFYGDAAAKLLFEEALNQVDRISDLPDEISASLEALAANDILRADALATAARLEEPFRAIAERFEERSQTSTSRLTPVSLLTEQSRMHPAICEIVSNTFYGGLLKPSDRVVKRSNIVDANSEALASPFVVLNLPSLSLTSNEAFEGLDPRPFSNQTEAIAIQSALGQFRPTTSTKEPPTLAVLSPYTNGLSL